MEILSIIPARGGSKGIPLKNLTLINGKPLLYYTVKASLNSKFVTRTIVSTDHKKIEKLAKKMGAEVIQRPRKFSTDKIRLEPVINHVISWLKKNENYIPDIIMILQNTSPLRNSKHIDESVKKFQKQKLDSLFSGCVFHSFLWKVQKDKTVKPVNYNPRKRPNRQEMKTQIHENGAIYVTKYNIFKTTNQRLIGRIGYYEMLEEFSYEIDSYNDKFIVEQILKKYKIE